MTARVPRQERGERRRDALLAAAVHVVADGGPAAFGARRVATEAGLPLAAVSYYYPRLDDLLGAAIAAVVSGWLDQARAVALAVESSGDRLDARRTALAITDALLPAAGAHQHEWPGHRAAIRRRYEHLLAAASYPVAAAALADLRPQLRQLVERIVLAGHASSVIGADPLIALLDGAAVGAVAESADLSDPALDGELRGRIAATVLMALTDSRPARNQPIQFANDRPETRS